MFCANCGAQVPDGTKFCPSCGKPCSTGEKVKQAAEDVFNKSEQELGNAFEDVKQNFQGGTGSTPPPYSGGRLKRKTARLLHTFYFHWLPVAYTVITSFTNWLRKLILPAREMASRLRDLLHLFYCHSLPAVFMPITGTTNWEIV